mmetsp:Transcript_21113/g.64305  ORF Transcript_21113/g.64305 Transcript_21113/m.64305 type:complete len:209 (-) Transcript_21113:269-895(-)
MVHPPVLRLPRRRVGVLGVVVGQPLLPRAAEHAEDAQREAARSEVRAPVLAQEAEADVAVGVHVRVLRRRLQEVDRRRLGGVARGEGDPELVLLALVERVLGARERHRPHADVVAHAHLAVGRRVVHELAQLLLDAVERVAALHALPQLPACLVLLIPLPPEEPGFDRDRDLLQQPPEKAAAPLQHRRRRVIRAAANGQPQATCVAQP